MLNNRLTKTVFHLTSVVTDLFPRAGQRFFDGVFLPLLGNRFLADWAFNKNLKTVRDAKSFKKILVVSDIHIGDAILALGGLVALRDYFPEARIDYVVNKTVACLFEGNPDISNLYPLFTLGRYPTDSDPKAVLGLAEENRYDLYMNYCPFLADKETFPPYSRVLNMMSMSAQIIRNLRKKEGSCHFMTESYEFPDGVLSRVMEKIRPGPFKGVPIYLADRAISEAESFLKDKKVQRKDTVFLLNPDAALIYNLIPFEYLLEILKGLLSMPGHVLLGSGFTAKDIEKRLLEKVSEKERARITVVPTSLALDAYGALTDSADVYIAADTGPMHMAAARKVSRSGKHKFRNKTFVVSIFGATNPRMSGYHSQDPLFPAANQDAPSRVYVSQSPCRNISCMNKLAKTCKKVRCFASLDTGRILSDIRAYIEGKLKK
jgi:ADP-heptose:LPS heptosyltransferase